MTEVENKIAEILRNRFDCRTLEYKDGLLDVPDVSIDERVAKEILTALSEGVKCPECEGTGVEYERNGLEATPMGSCPTCKGTGKRQMEQLAVDKLFGDYLKTDGSKSLGEFMLNAQLSADREIQTAERAVHLKEKEEIIEDAYILTPDELKAKYLGGGRDEDYFKNEVKI